VKLEISGFLWIETWLNAEQFGCVVSLQVAGGHQLETFGATGRRLKDDAARTTKPLAPRYSTTATTFISPLKDVLSYPASFYAIPHLGI
jgi:hypothetical protein